MLNFIIGLVIGANIGFVMAAILVAAKRGEKQ
jgi:gas vesicle protein